MRTARLQANLATLANAAVGVGAVAYVLAGNKLWAMLLIVCGVGFDGLDGWLSRRGGLGPSRGGRVADSVADAVTFGIAPASLLLVHTDRVALWQSWGTEATVAAAAVAGCAIVRLVYFTVRGYASPYFVGAPTPQTALGLVGLLLLFDTPAFLGTNPGTVLGLAVGLAALGVVPLHFPKIRRGAKLRPLATATAVALTLALVPLQFHLAHGSALFLAAELLSFVAVAGVVGYYVLGPFTAGDGAPAPEGDARAL